MIDTANRCSLKIYSIKTTNLTVNAISGSLLLPLIKLANIYISSLHSVHYPYTEFI